MMKIGLTVSAFSDMKKEAAASDKAAATALKKELVLPYKGQIQSSHLAAVHNILGLIYSRKHELQTALQHFARSVHLTDEHEKACYNRGLVYLKLNAYKTAVNEFQDAVNSNPQFADAVGCLFGEWGVGKGEGERRVGQWEQSGRTKLTHSLTYSPPTRSTTTSG